MATDIVLVGVPKHITSNPPMALASLKAVCTEHGFSSKCLDFNIEFYREFANDPDFIHEMELYFQIKLRHELKPDYKKRWTNVINEWVKRILSFKPKFVGLSVFSFNTCACARDLILALKEKSPSTEIIIGGNGLYDNYFKENELLEQGLIDFYVKGEGEKALIDILTGKIDEPGINGRSPEQIENLDALPFSDFSDFDLDLYDKKLLLITGSRGCVRNCSFCDVGVIWKKFRYRSGKNLAEEMFYQFQRHGTKSFFYTDSLINGSLKTLLDLCTNLVSFYKDNNIEKFDWGGQFIVRSRKSMNEEKFKLCAEAGMKFVSIGVESGSDRVKAHMKKKFTNEDLDFTLDQCEKYGIDVNLLFIIGYPTETEEDFQETLDMLTRYKKYVDSGTLKNINLGNTLSILPNTPLYEQMGDLLIEAEDLNNWHSQLNPELDLRRRIERRILAQDHAENLGYILPAREEQRRYLEARLARIKD